jgi:putative methionine-R-sulfoxide reductase with GAF domain
LAKEISFTRNVDLLLDQLVTRTAQVVRSEAASLYLLNTETLMLDFAIVKGHTSEALRNLNVHLRPGEGIAGWVAQHWKPDIVNDTAKDDRFMKVMDNTTGFVTRSVLAVPLMIGGELIGVAEAINKKDRGSFDESDKKILQNLANFAAVSITNAKLAENQKNFFTNMIEILTAAIEARDPRTMGHPTRVAALACAIGKKMGMEGESYRMLYYAGLLHDIGMIAVNHEVLMDQASLLARDRSVERVHPVLGAELIKGVKLFAGIVPLVRHHHELWDGTGYPDRLSGESIPWPPAFCAWWNIWKNFASRASKIPI